MHETTTDPVALAFWVSLGAALATVAVLRLKAWIRGELDDEAPMLRHLLAYFLGYLAIHGAMYNFEAPVSLIVSMVAASLAFAVTMHGPKPLFSMAYVRTAAMVLVIVILLMAIYQVLLLFGIDLVEKDFVRRA